MTLLSVTSTGQWTQAGKTRKYSFTYDPLSRLTNAAYTGDGSYGTSYSYDRHGNMTSLSRYGNTGTSTCGLIDNLTMTYDGNRLLTVEDSAANPTLPASADFRNGINTATEYQYDANGNMTKDLNRGISDITYNSLNLPSSLTIGGVTNSYLYASDGTRLRVTRGTNVTDYVGNAIYENGVLKRILVDGGYIENGVYHFYLTDHLGNNRIVANQSGTVVQSTQYYPYGMALADGTSPSAQPYKYNGKELDSDRGLNLYNYEARYMDGALGRFTTMDPLAEKYYSISPYAYCVNNPVKYVDPTGMDIWEMDRNGHVVWKEEDKEKHTLYALNKEGERTGKSLTVKDRSILDGLAQARNVKEYNGSYAATKSAETGNIFTFASENTDVEWGYAKFTNGDYVITTEHLEGKVSSVTNIKGYDEENLVFKAHSHPGEDGTKGASVSKILTDDMDNIIGMAHRFNKQGIYYTRFPKHFVYHPSTKILYQYTPYNSSINLGPVNSATPINTRIKYSKSPYFKN